MYNEQGPKRTPRPNGSKPLTYNSEAEAVPDSSLLFAPAIPIGTRLWEKHKGMTTEGGARRNPVPLAAYEVLVLNLPKILLRPSTIRDLLFCLQ